MVKQTGIECRNKKLLYFSYFHIQNLLYENFYMVALFGIKKEYKVVDKNFSRNAFIKNLWNVLKIHISLRIFMRFLETINRNKLKFVRF